ncbi:hypothetical protein PSQ90_14320 [Devosia rhodophyticola]|uniref:Uncharacterized protein n=1 Tax=Devosia rhodophyticola TaxID=3026423 RepID=A0ABY7YW77_9HYPH|nr:hypothetical protein [Devosia rhodophyticola]WDR05442.1 hypothetical protein PSQ90_14320 [Devosia rhodophyticola]
MNGTFRNISRNNCCDFHVEVKMGMLRKLIGVVFLVIASAVPAIAAERATIVLYRQREERVDADARRQVELRNCALWIAPFFITGADVDGINSAVIELTDGGPESGAVEGHGAAANFGNEEARPPNNL